MNLLKVGIDEAGRGCVLGPLCIGIAAFPDTGMEIHFKNAGVKDSKKLSIRAINELRDFISFSSYSSVKEVSEKEIDDGNINELTLNSSMSLFRECVKDWCVEKVELYLDCPTSNTSSYKKKVQKRLDFSGIGSAKSSEVIAENRADDKFIVVSAASIIAKHHREFVVGLIKNKYEDEYGDIGSGYPSDSRTVDFLKSFYKKNKAFPKETRMSWGTIDKVKNGT
jgi:ribonuclease HII